MYEHVNWMTCKHCGTTDTLFKLRVDHYYKRQTGSIRYKTTQKCKLCYLEDNNVKAGRYYKKNKDLLLLKEKLSRADNKEFYNKRARAYYKRHRLKRLKQKKDSYISTRRSLGLVARVRQRDHIRSR